MKFIEDAVWDLIKTLYVLWLYMIFYGVVWGMYRIGWRISEDGTRWEHPELQLPHERKPK